MLSQVAGLPAQCPAEEGGGSWQPEAFPAHPVELARPAPHAPHTLCVCFAWAELWWTALLSSTPHSPCPNPPKDLFALCRCRLDPAAQWWWRGSGPRILSRLDLSLCSSPLSEIKRGCGLRMGSWVAAQHRSWPALQPAGWPCLWSAPGNRGEASLNHSPTAGAEGEALMDV